MNSSQFSVHATYRLQKHPDCFEQIIIPQAASNKSIKSPMISPLFNHSSQLLPLIPHPKQIHQKSGVKSQIMGSPSQATREFTMRGYKTYSADDLYSSYDC